MSYTALVELEVEITGIEGTLINLLKSQGIFAKRNLHEEKIQMPVLLYHFHRSEKSHLGATCANAARPLLRVISLHDVLDSVLRD